MKTICLYFQVHQPMRFRRYRFFDIGESHYYYDDYANESIMRKIAGKCYLPANKVMLELIDKHGKNFRVAYSITGVALDQFKLYAPEVIESFKELAATGQVEFLAETYSHSLVSLADPDDFKAQVTEHGNRIESLFGVKPKVFRNTELVYSDDIGAMVADMGYNAMLTEGAKHILGWKSPNFLYRNALNSRLKVLLKNYKLSDDIAFRFSDRGWSEWPLTAQKYAGWLKDIDKKEKIINLFMDYETFGEHHLEETGIFEFLRALPGEILKHKEFGFSTPSEVAAAFQPVDAIHVPYPVSWADEERDLSAWLGNDMQNDAFSKLNGLREPVQRTSDPEIGKDWRYLQISDHLYYMSTKFFSDGEVHKYFNPYESPYDAFINYMNILSDFTGRVNEKAGTTRMETASLQKIIKEQNEQLESLHSELRELKDRKKIIASPAEAADEHGLDSEKSGLTSSAGKPPSEAIRGKPPSPTTRGKPPSDTIKKKPPSEATRSKPPSKTTRSKPPSKKTGDKPPSPKMTPPPSKRSGGSGKNKKST